MNVIRLTYFKDVDPMVIKYIITFFRFAGIEVQENFIDLINDSIAWPFSPKTTKEFTNYEFEIQFVSSLTDNYNKNSSLLYIAPLESYVHPYFFTERLLRNLSDEEYISSDEFFDLQCVLDVYRRYQVFNTLVKSNQPIKANLNFEEIFYALLDVMKKYDTKFGTPKLVHTQTAAMITLYKYDCFNRLKGEPLPVLVPTIIKKCELIKRVSNDLACKNITRLEALTYAMIEENLGKAGNVSYDFRESIDRFHTYYAISHNEIFYNDLKWGMYENTLSNFKNDFTSWLCLGEGYNNSYNRNNRKCYKEAKICFENAFQILFYRLTSGYKLVPDEIDQMYFIISNLIKLYCYFQHEYKKIELERRIEIIERSLNSLDKAIESLNRFCTDENEFQLLKKSIYEKANLIVIYNYLKYLSSSLGNKRKTDEYNEKILKLSNLPKN